MYATIVMYVCEGMDDRWLYGQRHKFLFTYLFLVFYVIDFFNE